ncbi:MAG: hypothetical protein GY838_05395, partial [bacterium]|nr:hypothetical protein [bacterium]
ASDQADRTATATIEVLVAAGDPRIFILSPGDGSSTNRNAIDVAGVVVGGRRNTADGTVTVASIVTEVDADGAFRTLDVPLAEGANTIVAEVTDPENRTGQTSVTVITDLTPPTIALLVDGQPLQEGASFARAVTVSVQITDNTADPPPPEVRLNGQPQEVTGPSLDLPIDTDGGYLVAVTAFDAAGNQTRTERSFIVDLSGCTLSDLEPSSESSVASSAVTIRGRSGGAEAISIRVPVPDSNPVQYQDYAAQLADGTFVAGDVPLPALGDNALEIVCTDAAGDTHTEGLLIHRLSWGDGPEIHIDPPPSGTLVTSRIITATGTVSDPTAKVSIHGVEAQVSEQPDGSGRFTVTTMLSEGPNVLAASAVDSVGRTGKDRIIVWRDTKAPPIKLTAPDKNSYVGPDGTGSARVDVTGLVDIDNEPNLTEIVVSTTQGSVTAVVAPDTGAFVAAGVPLDATLTDFDAQTITVTASDSLDQVSTSTVDIYFDPTGPAIVLSAPPDLGRFQESGPSEIVITGEVWAAEGARISINGGTIDPLSLTWDGPGADGRRHTSFSATLALPTEDGRFGIICQVTELD